MTDISNISSIDHVGEALSNLRPKAQWGIKVNELTWKDDVQTEPLISEIQTEVTRLEEEWTAQEYARNRKSEYPSQGDQNDMIYKDNKNSTTTHADAVEAVKTKWPKDNSGPV